MRCLQKDRITLKENWCDNRHHQDKLVLSMKTMESMKLLLKNSLFIKLLYKAKNLSQNKKMNYNYKRFRKPFTTQWTTSKLQIQLAQLHPYKSHHQQAKVCLVKRKSQFVWLFQERNLIIKREKIKSWMNQLMIFKKANFKTKASLNLLKFQGLNQAKIL